MATKPRNIILLSCDALRADHLSWYGYDRQTSPNIDEFAGECLRFSNSYSASANTREGVPALLTGKYSDVAIDESFKLDVDTVGNILSKEGFSTAAFHSNPYASRAFSMDRGFDRFDDDLHLGNHKLIALIQRALDKLRNRHYARANEINDRSLAWIDERESPFFLWNHYMDTHGPYEPPGKFRTKYAEREISDRDAQSLYRRAIKDPESITDDEQQLLIDLYDGEIRYNDEQIRVFLDELRERDLLEDSLIIFTADHGDAFGEHGYYEHPRYLHPELTHVPLFVRPPGGADKTIDVPASTLDVVATIEDAIGREGSGDGVSLLGSLPEDRRVFSQVRGEDENIHIRRYAIRNRNNVVYCERDQNTEEITFTNDSDQSLRDELREFVEERVQIEKGMDTEDDEVNDEIERRLSALGYKE